MLETGSLSEKCFSEFVELIHKLTGITVASNRTSMIEGRLRKRVNLLGLPSYEDYLKLAREDQEEQTHFIDLVTTNETYFFRTPRIWEYIEKTFLPSWFAQHPKKEFIAWSAAASSGEEAHSLGILCEAFKSKNPSFLYRIVGTDISKEMVALCENGRYSGKSIDSFKRTRPDLFQRYMNAVDHEEFQASQEIRSRIRFQSHNLLTPFLLSERFDLVLIRNVLIYFKGSDQEKVLSLVASRLQEDGVLIIGESESLSHISTPFRHICPLIYELNNAQRSVPKASGA